MRYSKFHPALAPSLVNPWIPQSSVNVKVREKIRLNQFYLQVHICFDSLCFWLASSLVATCIFLTASFVIGCFGSSLPAAKATLFLSAGSDNQPSFWLGLNTFCIVDDIFFTFLWECWFVNASSVMTLTLCQRCDSSWVQSPSALSNLSWWRHQGAIHLLRVYPNMTYRQ